MASRSTVRAPLRFLSLCSGIGGIDLAAEMAGMQIVGQVEIDPYCRRVLAKHWPNVKRVDDIRKVWGYDFGSVDVVAGGIPCQPFSVAGKRRGASDDRYLWPEMLRIVQIYEPTWVIVENVTGFVGMALDHVLADLGAAGYEARVFVLPAAAVGAPHKRERCFVVAHTRCTGQSAGRLGGGLASLGPLAHDGTTDSGDGLANAIGSGTGMAVHHSRRQAWSDADSPSSTLVRRTHGARRTEGADAGSREDVADSACDAGQCEQGQRQGVRNLAAINGAEGIVVRTGQAQPGMGGEPDGLPRRVDGAPRHPWPAGPGEAQHPWEAPRTVTGTVRDRAARLKALGNAVVPQQVFPILAAIVAAEMEANHASA